MDYIIITSGEEGAIANGPSYLLSRRQGASKIIINYHFVPRPSQPHGYSEQPIRERHLPRNGGQ